MAFHIHYNSNKEKKLRLYGLFWQSQENCYWWNDLKNKSDNHIPIFQSSWTTLVMRWQQTSLSKSLLHIQSFFFLPYYKICCLVFIFLFLSSASQSPKKRNHNFQCLVLQTIFLHYWTKFTSFCVAEVFFKKCYGAKTYGIDMSLGCFKEYQRLIILGYEIFIK